MASRDSDSKDFPATAKVAESDVSTHSDEDVQGHYGSGRDHAFSDPAVAAHWRNIYEKAQYEGRHRFDPDLTWSAQEEKKLVRKVR